MVENKAVLKETSNVIAPEQKYDGHSHLLLAKRRKLELEAYWKEQTNFMGNVVPKKSRLELEKEASIRQQMEEKENEIKKLKAEGKGGILIKFDLADSHISGFEAAEECEKQMRGSISPKR